MKFIHGAVLLSFLLLAPSAMAAGFVVRGGQVELVSSTTGNGPAFVVRVVGGNGVCADSTVKFQEENAGDADVFKRSFAVALTAMATGLPVDIYSYGERDCASPSYIRVTN